MDNFINAHLTRQLDLIPVEALTRPVHIIGVGAIGSFTALMLAKMGMTNITVYDPDIVSVENMSCQLYRHKDIGKPKVLALREIVNDFTGTSLDCVCESWNIRSPYDLKGIVVSCADSMDVRNELFAHCRNNFGVDWFIDSRMGAESALMYVMNAQVPKDQEAYLATLYSDKEAISERCTAKSTIYTANLLSGHVAKAVKNLITKADYPRITMWNIASNQKVCYSGTI